jgi:carboxypeptidase C (cathepsin A)
MDKGMLKKYFVFLLAFLFSTVAINSFAQEHGKKEDKKAIFKPADRATTGSVTVNGHNINYKAVAGNIYLQNDKGDTTARMFYVAYMKEGVSNKSDRPVTFLYNGGPGSSTLWLHMGSFGPRRIVVADSSHTNPAPYQFVNNQYSLLDVSDLVFIDAPGTGFSRIVGSGTRKDFYGVDEDGHAFAQFITGFLSKYDRWNSPKYLFGESYGTTRSGVLSRYLETQHDVDLNGVILLSQILSYDISNDDNPSTNPGMDLTYELALPTYAATAWYHHKLPNRPADLQPFLKEVEHFAMNGYTQALQKGYTLDAATKKQVAKKMHEYIGLPVKYLMKADLRVSGGQFEHELLGDKSMSTGRLDTRFSGYSMDPLSEVSQYDPQASSISSAYVSMFNHYIRQDLKYGKGMKYKPEISLWRTWNYLHQPPGSGKKLDQATNVMPDLTMAMKYNPKLHVMLNSGYFDLATPFYAAVYAMHHLQIPAKLAQNIEYKYYDSGHMVYVHLPSLKKLHDNVADFIEKTDNVNQ